MTTDAKIERQKLFVITVMEPKPFGTREPPTIKYSCKVKSGDKEFLLQTFSKKFGDYFKPGETIDAEYSITSRENANDPEHPWIDRKVSQIFVDGKPIEGEKGGRSWGGNIDSPEKRASIERQSCLNAAVEIWTNPPTSLTSHDTNDILRTAQIFYDWVSGKITATEKAKKLPSDGEPPTPRAPEGKAAQTEAVADKKYANLGEFLEAALLKGYKTKKSVEDKLGQKLELIGNLEEAFKKL